MLGVAIQRVGYERGASSTSRPLGQCIAHRSSKLRDAVGRADTIVVIGELLVEEGMEVHAGQVLAVLVGIEVLRTELERLSGALANAEKELEWN